MKKTLIVLAIMAIASTGYALQGDVNEDGTVDILDLQELSTDWLDPWAAYVSYDTDLNNDNAVNLIDFSIISDNWLEGLNRQPLTVTLKYTGTSFSGGSRMIIEHQMNCIPCRVTIYRRASSTTQVPLLWVLTGNYGDTGNGYTSTITGSYLSDSLLVTNETISIPSLYNISGSNYVAVIEYWPNEL